jgi:hypothetical protein
MASPSLAENQDQIRRGIKILNELRQYGDVNSDNYIGMEDALVQVLETDYPESVGAALGSIRSSLATAMQSGGQALLAPLFRDLAKIMTVPETDIASIFRRARQYFYDNSLRVTTRGFLFPAVSAGSNTGTGTIVRHCKDDHGFPIENAWPESYSARCIADASSGTAKHEERFEVRGTDPARDAVQLRGSGTRDQLASISARSSLLANSTFTNGTLAATTTWLNDWTTSVTGTGNFTLDTTNYYRGDPNDGDAPQALNIKATANVVQALTVNNVRLDASTPYFLQVAWNRSVGGASGTLTVYMGSQSTTVAVAAQSGWQLLQVGPFFPRQFAETAMDIRIEWTRTAGDLLVDDVLFVPGQQYNGLWYWLIGGATAFLLDDTFTWTDLETGAILQYWFWRLFREYLPSQLVAPSVAPTDALAGAGAGGVDNGVHYYKYTYTDALGRESAASPASDGVTVVDNATDGQVTVTWTAGSAHVTGAKIYRTIAGDGVGGTYKLVASDAVSPYIDTTADGSLGAVAPTQDITWAEPTA